jgi:hypothetical protein
MPAGWVRRETLSNGDIQWGEARKGVLPFRSNLVQSKEIA